MKYLTATLLISSLIFFAPAINAANEGHGHSHSHDQAQPAISREEAKGRATEKVKQLVDDGKIDTTWSTVTVSGIEQKTFSHDPEWVIVFNNDKIADASKQNLYVFFTLEGKYIAANFTGT